MSRTDRTKITVEFLINGDIEESEDFIKELIQEGILVLSDENEEREVSFEITDSEPAELPSL